MFSGEWDDDGVYVYQAFNDKIADWALEHQRFGGPDWRPARMTWIKPSFAWVLYRSGYASKSNQTRILKVKLPHTALAEMLAQCECKEGGGGSNGRVQWDPARDILAGDDAKREPRMMLRQRAIQIGLRGALSQLYVASATSIEDVTDLAVQVGHAHHTSKRRARKKKDSKAGVAQPARMEDVLHLLPNERPYTPRCTPRDLQKLAMAAGPTATAVARIGLGKAYVTNSASA